MGPAVRAAGGCGALSLQVWLARADQREPEGEGAD